MRVTSDVIFIVCTLIDDSYEPISAQEFGQLLYNKYTLFNGSVNISFMILE